MQYTEPSFPKQGSNLGPVLWELSVLGTGPPEKSLVSGFFATKDSTLLMIEAEMKEGIDVSIVQNMHPRARFLGGEP